MVFSGDGIRWAVVVKVILAVLANVFLICTGPCVVTEKGKKMAVSMTLERTGWDAVAVMVILTRPVRESWDGTGLYALGMELVGRWFRQHDVALGCYISYLRCS